MFCLTVLTISEEKWKWRKGVAKWPSSIYSLIFVANHGVARNCDRFSRGNIRLINAFIARQPTLNVFLALTID